MAYYLVKYKGATYVNRDLAKRMHSVGDVGLFDLLADGKIAQETILDNRVFKVSSSPNKHLMPFVKKQDLDAQIGRFEPSEEKGSYIISSACPGLCLDGVQYVRLSDIVDPSNRYRSVFSLPHVVFLGKKYVALGVKLKDKDCLVAVRA